MLEAVICRHCNNAVGAGQSCPVCGHDLGPGECHCLFCVSGLACSDRTVTMLLVMAVRSAWDDLLTARGIGTPPTITESTVDRLARAVQALEG